MFRILLLPFSYFYGFVLRIRHFLYDSGLLHAKKFDIPVIVVGNLRVGGTGKTPHTLLIASLLSSGYKIAFLSRGYGRKTKGYHEVKLSDTASIAGDEPLLFKQAFPESPVVVCESRVDGIRKLVEEHPETDVVLLDDAYQHRKLKPGFSVLLIDRASFFSFRALLPAGNERDLWSRRKKADVLIVSKSAENDAASDKIRNAIAPLENQHLFFSSYRYDDLYSFDGHSRLPALELKNKKAVLVTALADPSPLHAYLEQTGCSVFPVPYPDHYLYNTEDIEKIRGIVAKFAGTQRLVITTSKDRVKLESFLNKAERAYWFEQKITVITEQESSFKKLLIEYVESTKRNRKLH